ncbi:MAG: BadF/BadG/BcrA/BcrD ATPase family protein [Pseudorhodobacter sp.]
MNDTIFPYVIACDGGGTGCRLVVADAQGQILARSSGGPANVTSNLDQALASLGSALADAAGQLGVAADDLLTGVAHFGLAGVQSGEDANHVAQAFPFARISVTEDRTIAIAGALGDADGVLIALGTGTIIAAQHHGQSKRIGGWGLRLSDDASGAWLGRALLAQVLRAHDGMEPFSPLSSRIFDRFGADPRALVGFAASARPADYASFAPEIIAAAKDGDAVARALMAQGAAYLTRALEAIGFGAGDVLCLSGGVGPHYAAYLPQDAQDAIVPAKGSGLDGALRLALALRD